MPVTPTYPGVYVQEVPSSVRTIVGVSTSTGFFLGAAARGPIGIPVLCLSWLDFTRVFGEDTYAGKLTHYVRLFFLNGGTVCWVMRLANGAQQSSVTLKNEDGADVLKLTAKSPGVTGDSVRAVVRYEGPFPEAAFTLELFRWELRGGTRVAVDREVFPNLTMDPKAPSFAPAVVTQKSSLVKAEEAGTVLAAPGYSQSGRPVVPEGNTTAKIKAAWAAVLGSTAATNTFQISVDGSPYVDVNLASIDVGALDATGGLKTNLAKAIENTINSTLTAAGVASRTVDVTIKDSPKPPSGLLCITCGGLGDVYVRPGGPADLAVSLMLGSAQGGLEVGAHAARRPAPNGAFLKATDLADINAVRELTQDAVTDITLPVLKEDGSVGSQKVLLDLVTSAPTDPFFKDADEGTDGLREKLGIIAAAINSARADSPQGILPWTAEVHGDRLVILLTGAPPDREHLLASSLATGTTNIAKRFALNIGAYPLGGAPSAGGFHTPGQAGHDGTQPKASDYDAAYAVADREVDLFNLMVLAPGDAAPVHEFYPKASIFCQKRRAVLLMDPPDDWKTPQQVIDQSKGVASLRRGLVKDHAALFFPRVTIDDAGRQHTIGPAGAVAGLIARIDGTRGVWKAPAGTEADLRGIIGLDRQLSDGEQGVLNPRGVNTLRVFPSGIVNYGARTMDGDDAFASQWKYLSVRRLAAYLEESLYRGLQWAVFEPNDEPLWAQIRLNVGAFMHGLFQRGAFAGPKRSAYFVKCDAETTSQNDRDLGIVNVHVGFAPVKPAEFVILYLQQVAGQIAV
ncbi:phage tail sheath family protein [Streptomyces sp. NPDC059874]|uniref:phage tail sheath family protein n=1 Tax=Streptomyces sp. NPDC059874 TaxID=3346983 RepID=UPI0036552973